MLISYIHKHGIITSVVKDTVGTQIALHTKECILKQKALPNSLEQTFQTRIHTLCRIMIKMVLSNLLETSH